MGMMVLGLSRLALPGLFAIFTLGSLLFFITSSLAEGIDCRRKSGSAQQAICTSGTLLELDAKLSEIVGQLIASTDKKQARRRISNELAKWRQSLERQCRENEQCLTGAYQQSIAKLERQTGAKEGNPESLQQIEPVQASSQSAVNCAAPQGKAQVAICEQKPLLSLEKETSELVDALLKKAGANSKAQSRIADRYNRWWAKIERHCGASEICLADNLKQSIDSLRAELGLPKREWPVEPPDTSNGALSLVKGASRQEGEFYSLQGLWEGNFNCGRPNLLTVEVNSVGENGEATLYQYPPRGQNGELKTLKYTFLLDPLLGDVELRAARGGGMRFKGAIAPDGNAISGSAAENVLRECGSFELARVTSPNQKDAVLAPVLAGPPASIEAPLLQAKDHKQFCRTLMAWGNQLLAEFPEIRTPQQFTYADATQKLNLYRDDKFEQYIGVSAFSIDKAQWKALNSGWQTVTRVPSTGKIDCGIQGQDNDFLRTYWSYIVDLQRGTYNNSNRFAASFEPIKRTLADKDRLVAAAGQMPPMRDSVEKLDGLIKDTGSRLDALWPSERKKFEVAVADARAKLADRVLDSLLGQENTRNDTLKYAGDLDYLAGAATAEKAAAAKGIVERKLAGYAAERLSVLPNDTGDLQELRIIVEARGKLHKDFQAFQDYAASRTALSDIDGRFGRSTDLITEKLANILSSEADVSAFGEQKASLLALHPKSHDSPDFKPLWDAYYRQADYWVVARMEAFQTGKSANKAAEFDAANPLGKSAAPSFDLNNPLGQTVGTEQAASPSEDDFLSYNWSFPEIIKGAYLNDPNAMYDADPERVLTYFAKLGGKVRMLCPSVAPTEKLARLLLRDKIGSDPFGKDKGKAIERTIKQYIQVMDDAINNPGAILEQSFEADETERKMEVDMQIIIRFSCDDPRLEKLFKNALAYLENPVAGVDPSKLGLRDICIANEMQGSTWEDAKDLCNCATDKLLGTLSQRERTFIAQRPEENWGTLLGLYPKYQVQVQQCAFQAMTPIDFK